MHVQVLASGSQGNSTLVRVGDMHILLDAGLVLRELVARLEAARVSTRAIDHIVLTHGHLDHARSSGALAKQSGARLHGSMRMMKNASLRGAVTYATLPIGGETMLEVAGRSDQAQLRTVEIPHDAIPTVALRLESEGRVCVLVTDMGHPEPNALKRLEGAHVLLLEFNHDPELLRTGPYDRKLKRRVSGPRGHLSNAQACEALRALAGPNLHTLVLTHLSSTNNTQELALAAARATLAELQRDDVVVHVATQDCIGPNLKV